MEVLSIAAIYSILIPFLLGLFYLRKLSDDSLKIWGIVTIGAIPQLLNPIIGKGIALNFAYNLYIPIEFLLFYLLFKKKLYNNILRNIFYKISQIYIVVIIILYSLNGITNRFLNEGICLNSIMYTSWILMLILEQYTEESKISIMPDTPIFWYILGTFLYALCTILIFSFWDFMEHGSPSISNTLMAVQEIFNINLYLMFSIGFLKDNFHKGTKIFDVSLH